MTILITGAAGQVGRELVSQIDEPAHAFSHHELDITDAGAVEAALATIRPHVVINCAGYTAVDRAETDRMVAEAVNVSGARNLAASCEKHGAALLHISTDYVFDGSKTAPYVESDQPHPQTVYGLTKWKGEQAIRTTVQRHVILRVSWVFGLYGENFVKTILRLAMQHETLRIVSDQHGAPTPAANIAETLLILARRVTQGRSLPWATYHYAGVPDTTWHEFASQIVCRAHAIGLLPKLVPVTAISTRQYPTPVRRPANSRLNCTAIATRLGVSRPDWRPMLDAVLQQMRVST